MSVAGTGFAVDKCFVVITGCTTATKQLARPETVLSRTAS